MLTQQFPNLVEFLTITTEIHKGGFVSEDFNNMSFMMPVYTFGHHVGDNWLILERNNNGYSFSIESRVKQRVKAKTSSTSIYTTDLSLEEWNQVVDKVLMHHAAKPEFLKFSQGKVGKKFERQMTGQRSGCMVLVTVLLIISFFMFLFIS